jgi:transposase
MTRRNKCMTEIRNIIHRLRCGKSKRSIHKELNVHRSIIRKLQDLAIAYQWLDPDLPMPSDEEVSKVWRIKTNEPPHPLDPYKEQFAQWNKQNFSSVVIHQLLQDKCPCDVQTIRRYRNKHFPKPIEPVMVRSTVAGRDMELDFGELGKFLHEDGTVKKVWLFSLRLRHSRKAYREAVTNQTLHTFLMGHVHAFEYFHGVSANCIHDNLKAAVIRSTIDNDMINRSYQELAEHYGFVISPCMPRTPEHKGGVEGDVKYVKRNFLPCFRARQKEMNIDVPRILDLVDALERWDRDVADVRIVHGVGRSPREIFKSEEAKALRPLAIKRWEPTSWSQCVVRREWRIMVECAYYSVPYPLIGKTVEVCVTHHVVRIFFEHKEVAFHEKAAEKWQYKRRSEHAPPFQEEVLQCTREGLLLLAQDVGPFTYQVAHMILSHPSVDKLKPVRHLLRLAPKYSLRRLELACQRAFNCKLFAYNSVKSILEKNLDSQPLDIIPKAKVIPLTSYRFARNPGEYKGADHQGARETFEETLARLHPISTHGNAMLGVWNGTMADYIMEEEERRLQEEKQ